MNSWLGKRHLRTRRFSRTKDRPVGNDSSELRVSRSQRFDPKGKINFWVSAIMD